MLRDIDAELTRYVAIGADQMRPGSRAAYGYALARRAALGEETEANAAEWLTGGGDSVRTRDLRPSGPRLPDDRGRQARARH